MRKSGQDGAPARRGRRRATDLEAAFVRALTIGLTASAAYALAVHHPFFRHAALERARPVWDWILAAFWALPLPMYLLTFRLRPWRRHDAGSKPLLLLALLRRGWKKVRHRDLKVLGSHHARLCVLSLLVKCYYLPVMTTFFVGQAGALQAWFARAPALADLTWRDWVLGSGYSFLYQSIFLIDTLIFSFAYAVELPLLRSRIRSVEPTLLGWLVTLACYPPFNSATDVFLGRAYGRVSLPPWLAGLSNAVVLVCFLVFLWASIALMFKASNLTHRGIVDYGPYRFVRHPAYAAKNIAWWFEWLPSLANPANILSVAGWNAIYVLRAVTEERHLRKDPAYREYCKRVEYRFVPGVI